jgi:hypothetical protein
MYTSAGCVWAAVAWRRWLGEVDSDSSRSPARRRILLFTTHLLHQERHVIIIRRPYTRHAAYPRKRYVHVCFVPITSIDAMEIAYLHPRQLPWSSAYFGVEASGIWTLHWTLHGEAMAIPVLAVQLRCCTSLTLSPSCRCLRIQAAPHARPLSPHGTSSTMSRVGPQDIAI